MRDWKYRHQTAGVENAGLELSAPYSRGWKMRDQAVMESQNAPGTGIVALTSSFFVCSCQAMVFGRPYYRPVFEKTCETTQKNVKSRVFWILKNTKKT